MSGSLSDRSHLLGSVAFSVLAAGLLALVPYLFPPIAFSATCGAIAIFGIAATCYSRHRTVASERDLDDRIRAAVVRAGTAKYSAIEPLPADTLYILTSPALEPAGTRAPSWFRRRLAALERAGELRRTERGYYASPGLARTVGVRA